MTITRYLNGREINDEDLKNIVLTNERVLHIVGEVKNRIEESISTS